MAWALGELYKHREAVGLPRRRPGTMQQAAPTGNAPVEAQPVPTPAVREAHPAANPHTATSQKVQPDPEVLAGPTRPIVDPSLPLDPPSALTGVEQAERHASHPTVSITQATPKVRRPALSGNYSPCNHILTASQKFTPIYAHLTRWKKQPAGAHPVLPLQRPVAEAIPENDLTEFNHSPTRADQYRSAVTPVPNSDPLVIKGTPAYRKRPAPKPAPGNDSAATIDTGTLRGRKRKPSDAVLSVCDDHLDGKNSVDPLRPIKKMKR